MISRIKRNIKSPVQLAKKIIRSRQNAKRLLRSDLDYWASLKDIHQGERGFVIGNGPSLRMSDLDLLTNEVSIASNKIYLAFGSTNWRPDYVTIADPLVWEKVRENVREHFSKVHIPSYLDRDDSAVEIYWRSKYMGLTERFSGDMGRCAFSGQTVTFENLQLAVHLGLNPIFIIGCDHNYVGESNVTAGKAIQQGLGKTHFISNYRKPGERVLPASIADMEASYREARKYCDKNGIQIFNATRGGQLEIFQRIDFDSISFKNKI